MQPTDTIQNAFVSPLIVYNVHKATARAPKTVGRATNTDLVAPPSFGLISGGESAVNERTWLPIADGNVLYYNPGMGKAGRFVLRHMGIKLDLATDERRYKSIVSSESNPRPVTGVSIRVSKNTAPMLASMGLITQTEASRIVSTAAEPTWAGAATNFGNAVQANAKVMMVLAVVAAAWWFIPRTGG